MLTDLATWIKYIHVIGGFMFLLGHGASVFVAFQLKKTKDLERMKVLMDVSASGWPVMMLSLLILLIAGIVSGFMIGAWSRLWIWASLVLLIGITGHRLRLKVMLSAPAGDWMASLSSHQPPMLKRTPSISYTPPPTPRLRGCVGSP